MLLGSCRGRWLGSLGLRRTGLLAVLPLLGVFAVLVDGWRERQYLVEAGLELGEDVCHCVYVLALDCE